MLPAFPTIKQCILVLKHLFIYRSRGWVRSTHLCCSLAITTDTLCVRKLHNEKVTTVLNRMLGGVGSSSIQKINKVTFNVIAADYTSAYSTGHSI